MKIRLCLMYLIICLGGISSAYSKTPLPDEGNPVNNRLGESVVAGDFNGDSIVDIAIGAPHFNNKKGQIIIEYGHGPSEYWTQNGNGNQDIAGSAEAGDYFGESLAVGDFNSDGFDDLAVGVPREAIGSKLFAGLVNIIYGSASGLTNLNNRAIYQSKGSFVGKSEAQDQYGHSLTTGDFNGDGFDDLAIGVPTEDIGDIKSAGAVNIVYGSASGLTDEGNQDFHQNIGSIRGAAEPYDYFGWSVSSGDINGDGYDDLVVGAMRESIGDIYSAGAINIIYGSASGLTDNNNQMFHQDKGSVIGKSETYDQFGTSLALGDFNGDGFADLSVGVPNEDIGDIVSAGGINIFYGSSSGLTDVNNQAFHQDKATIKSKSETIDSFGWSLSSGDFNGDGIDDLAVGVVGESIGSTSGAGMVNILFGTHAGLSDKNNIAISESIDGIGNIGARHEFGHSIASADFDLDGKSDLIIGTPGNFRRDTVTYYSTNYANWGENPFDAPASATCTLVDTSGYWHASDCNTGGHFACFNIKSHRWMISYTPGSKISDGANRCGELGSHYVFKSPESRAENKDLTDTLNLYQFNGDVFINNRKHGKWWKKDLAQVPANKQFVNLFKEKNQKGVYVPFTNGTHKLPEGRYESVSIPDNFQVDICNTFTCFDLRSMSSPTIIVGGHPLESMDTIKVSDKTDYSFSVKLGMLLGYLCGGDENAGPLSYRVDSLEKRTAHPSCPSLAMFEQDIAMDSLREHEDFSFWDFINPFGKASIKFDDPLCRTASGVSAPCFVGSNKHVNKQTVHSKALGEITGKEEMLVEVTDSFDGISKGLYYRKYEKGMGKPTPDRLMSLVPVDDQSCYQTGSCKKSKDNKKIKSLGPVTKIGSSLYLKNRCQLRPSFAAISSASLSEIANLANQKVPLSLDGSEYILTVETPEVLFDYFEYGCSYNPKYLESIERSRGDNSGRAFWGELAMSITHAVEGVGALMLTAATGGAAAEFFAPELVSALSSIELGETATTVLSVGENVMYAANVGMTINDVYEYTNCPENDAACRGKHMGSLILNFSFLANDTKNLFNAEGAVESELTQATDKFLEEGADQIDAAKRFQNLRGFTFDSNNLAKMEEIAADGRLEWDEIEELDRSIYKTRTKRPSVCFR